MLQGDEYSNAELLSSIPEVSIKDYQQIGEKVILKGSAMLDCCFAGERGYPIRKNFTAPLSQIIDTGAEDFDSYHAKTQLTAAYFELIDTINGEKALSVELHGVIQLLCGSKAEISYISDAYNNSMPCSCKMKEQQISESCEEESLELEHEEHVEIAEPYKEILFTAVKISQAGVYKGKLRALLNLDIIYTAEEAGLGMLRRIVNIEENIGEGDYRLLNKLIKACSFQNEEGGICVKISCEFLYRALQQTKILYAEGLELLEDESYEQGEFPGLCLVRQENESLWELAKHYHSSPETIEFMNPEMNEGAGYLLFIPKES